MNDLKIYVDRLKHGQSEKIDITVPSDFLEIKEEELSFREPVHIRIEAYLANEHLITHLDIETAAFLPCSICNTQVRIPLASKGLYLSTPLSEIKNAVFDTTDEIRESVLLQAPLFAECNGGNCPERKNIKQFLEKTIQEKKSIEEKYFPFADQL
jgi:uncharacterized metal-binding protein YceD (DUF177 family)